MIGLDTNVLARYYIEDKQDAEATRQRVAAKRLIESGQALMVCKTVILELEWVMRGYYGFSPDEVILVLRHLMSLVHVTVEDRNGVENGTIVLRSWTGPCGCVASCKLSRVQRHDVIRR
jgi:predicted nucleic-acid-binding protein